MKENAAGLATSLRVRSCFIIISKVLFSLPIKTGPSSPIKKNAVINLLANTNFRSDSADADADAGADDDAGEASPAFRGGKKSAQSPCQFNQSSQSRRLLDPHREGSSKREIESDAWLIRKSSQLHQTDEN